MILFSRIQVLLYNRLCHFSGKKRGKKIWSICLTPETLNVSANEDGHALPAAESAGGAELRVTDWAMRRRGGRSNARTLSRRWMAPCWQTHVLPVINVLIWRGTSQLDVRAAESRLVEVGLSRTDKVAQTKNPFTPAETSTCTLRRGVARVPSNQLRPQRGQQEVSCRSVDMHGRPTGKHPIGGFSSI